MILALQTSDHTAHLWLYQAAADPQPLAEFSWESGRQLADQLLGQILEFTAEHGQAPESLSGVVIYSGPGSFTSLRIGHSVANALADSLGVPVASAQGEHWQREALAALGHTPVGQPVLPAYGAEANITKPKT